MSKEVVKSVDETQDAIEKCLLEGDLSKLSLDQRLSYYKQVCETVGLNPLTKPFQYIVLNGKLTMYALKGATDQLRKIYNINCTITKEAYIEDIYVVTVEVKDKTGRIDVDMGFAKVAGMKGDMLGNAMLKAVTKAKRRATLSMCGLGMLDEDEVATIQDDVGSGKGKKAFDAPELKGIDKLEATLSKSEKEQIIEEEKIMEKESEEYHKNGKHPEASKQWLNDSILQLNRIFARYNDHDGTELTADNPKIVDTLSGLVEDLRNKVVDYGVDYEGLRTWAKDHPGNKVELKRYATTHNEDWQDTMVTDDYDELHRWMEFLAKIFKAKEEVA